MLDFLLLFFVHVFSKVSNAKAIHNNTGSFCHKCSEPLNVHQSNLALLVCILCMFYYFLLSVAIVLFMSQFYGSSSDSIKK